VVIAKLESLFAAREVSIEYVELVDYLAIAVEVTGLSVETITRVAKLHLADSALHAPAAGFGATEFYPEFVDKPAVLIVRLAKNHPLPDGNKCAASMGFQPAPRSRGNAAVVHLLDDRRLGDSALRQEQSALRPGRIKD
jgi:hypothetical protein